MRKALIFTGVVLTITVNITAQKSRVISANQLIETGQFEEAKEAIDLAVINEKTSGWHRTYFVKGLLCQKAFEAGFDKKDTKKTNLYPYQLFVAYESYEKALELDTRKRIQPAVETQYYGLANDFQKLGEWHFLNSDYNQALNAFEHAIMVGKSPLLSVVIDTNLVYNTAMAAFESMNWQKAILYLSGLDQDAYSPEISVLLYKAYMVSGDSLKGENALRDGLEKYDFNQTLVLQLVDFYLASERWDDAVVLMDTAIAHKPDNYYFPWTRGLLHQNREMYLPAIEDLKRASELAPEEVTIFYNLGICYYNIGVEISESALSIRNISEYHRVRAEAKTNFLEAVVWFEKAHEANPDHQPTIAKLYQLYSRLEMTEKRNSLK